MEIAYLHLVTNHIPIIGVPFGIVILLFGIWLKNDTLKHLAFLVFIFLGLATIAVFLLGQGGEDFIEELPGVSHDAIEEHEEFAKFPLITVLIAAAVSLFALIRYGGFAALQRRGTVETQDRTVPAWLSIAVLALGIAAAALLGYTGRLGGVIRHPEFHGGVTAFDTKNEADKENEGVDSGRGRGRGRGGN